MTVKPTKEYFRKPYLVEDKADSDESEHSDYRYMMDTDWQRAQDSSYIVVQSVRKKPYLTDDYQEMEQKADGFTGMDWNLNWNWQWPKFNWNFGKSRITLIPPTQQQSQETENISGKLYWLQYPSTVGTSKTYTVIVGNSYTSQRTYVGGKLQYDNKTYLPTGIYLKEKSSNANGLAITGIWQRNGVTFATLSTLSTARGSYYIYATDGTNVINRVINVSSSTNEGIVVYGKKFGGVTKYYWKLDDLISNIYTPYTTFASTKTYSPYKTPYASVVTTDDNGRPVRTITESYAAAWGGVNSYYATLTNVIQYDVDSSVIQNDTYGETVWYDTALGAIWRTSYLTSKEGAVTVTNLEHIYKTYHWCSFNPIPTEYDDTYEKNYVPPVSYSGYHHYYDRTYTASNWVHWGIDYDDYVYPSTDTLRGIITGVCSGVSFADMSISIYPDSIKFGTVS